MKHQTFEICCFFTLLFLFSCHKKEKVTENLENEKSKIFYFDGEFENKLGGQYFNEKNGDFLNSFGKVRIGMDIKEFNELFKENLKDTLGISYRNNKGSFTRGFKELDIEKNIKLKMVLIQFCSGKLCRISSGFNEELFIELQRKYGGNIMSRNQFIFPTDSLNVFCEYGLTRMELNTLGSFF